MTHLAASPTAVVNGVNWDFDYIAENNTAGSVVPLLQSASATGLLTATTAML